MSQQLLLAALHHHDIHFIHQTQEHLHSFNNWPNKDTTVFPPTVQEDLLLVTCAAPSNTGPMCWPWIFLKEAKNFNHTPQYFGLKSNICYRLYDLPLLKH